MSLICKPNVMKLRQLFRASMFLIGLLLFSSLADAQSTQKNDVIVKRDSSKIQALIIQMTYDKINYRDLGTSDSAKTYIYLDQVAKVLLKNGKIINVRDSVQVGHVPPDSVGQYADMANLPSNAFEKSIVMANSDQLRDKYLYQKNKSIDGLTGAIVFGSLGAASLITGIIVASNGSTDNKKFGTALMIAGPVIGGGLGLLGFINWRSHRAKAQKIKTELERRNQPLSSIKISPAVDPFNKFGMVTLKMSF